MNQRLPSPSQGAPAAPYCVLSLHLLQPPLMLPPCIASNATLTQLLHKAQLGDWASAVREQFLLACHVRLRLAGVVQTRSYAHRHESARQLHCMRVSMEPPH